MTLGQDHGTGVTGLKKSAKNDMNIYYFERRYTKNSI